MYTVADKRAKVLKKAIELANNYHQASPKVVKSWFNKYFAEFCPKWFLKYITLYNFSFPLVYYRISIYIRTRRRLYHCSTS